MRMTDEELLAAAQPWWDRLRAIRAGRGDPAWEAWNRGFTAWCEQHGTDAVELIRLRGKLRMRRLRAECEAAGGTWRGSDWRER
jgi:hypothetical protein